MSELKILIHIGHHLNVVNLLGACTKAGGEESSVNQEQKRKHFSDTFWVFGCAWGAVNAGTAISSSQESCCCSCRMWPHPIQGS